MRAIKVLAILAAATTEIFAESQRAGCWSAFRTARSR